jgi:hypothetical protein
MRNLGYFRGVQLKVPVSNWRHAAANHSNLTGRRSVHFPPPAPDFAASSRRACVPPFLRLDLIFREPYLAEAVTSLNVGIEATITPVDRRLPLNQTNVLPAIRARMTPKHSPQLESFVAAMPPTSLSASCVFSRSPADTNQSVSGKAVQSLPPVA